MSKTVLANVDGFTPLIDAVTQQHGIITAAVFGRMWRYCQGTYGVCQATLERIGVDLGVNKATVQRHAQKLCDLGYLEDTTPDLRNKPHTYRDTGKAGLAINIHVAQSNVTLQSATSRCTEQRDVAESQLKIEVKREDKKQPGVKVPRPPDLLFDAVAEVCAGDTKLNGSTIGKVTAELRGAGYTPDDVRAFGKDWWAWDKRTKAPSVWKLKDGISQIKAQSPASKLNGHRPPGFRLPDGI